MGLHNHYRQGLGLGFKGLGLKGLGLHHYYRTVFQHTPEVHCKSALKPVF